MGALRSKPSSVALALAISGVAAAGLALRGGPTSALAATALPLLLGGAARPLLVRATPHEPSALKLWAFGALFSLPLLALIRAVAAVGLGPGANSLALTFVLTAALQCLALRSPGEAGLDTRPGAAGLDARHNAGQREGARRFGSAPVIALLFAVAFAAAIGWVLFAGAGAALTRRPEVLWHTGVVQEVLARGLFGALEHPWFVGAPLPTSPAVGALAALLTESTGLAPLYSVGALAVFSGLLAPVFVYLVAASVWRDGKRDLGALALAFVGWNAGGGLWPTELAAPIGNWARDLGRGAPYASHGEVLYGGAPWLLVGGLPLALVYSLGALAAGIHAVRHGQRPWPLCAALCVSFAALLYPTIGAGVGAALLLAALVAGGTPRARFVVPLAVALAFLPAIGSVARFGLAPDLATPALRRAPWSAALWPAALLLLTAVPWLAAFARRGQSARATAPTGAERAPGPGLPALALLVCAAAAPYVWLAVLPEGRREVGPLGAAAALPLGVLAAGALGRALAAGGIARALGALVALALAVGAARASRVAVAAHAALARAPSSLVSIGHRVVERPTDAIAADVVACLDWIADQEELAAARAVLVQRPPGARRSGGPTAPSSAPLATGLHLWWDSPPGLVARSGVTSFGDVWRSREAIQRELYSQQGDWNVFAAQWFERLGRPVIFVVDEHDRGATTERGVGPRGVDHRLLQWGAREAFRVENAAVYVLQPTAPR